MKSLQMHFWLIIPTKTECVSVGVKPLSVKVLIPRIFSSVSTHTLDKMVFASRVGPGVRSLMTTAVKSSGHDFGGVPGGKQSWPCLALLTAVLRILGLANLPFDTRSPRKLAIIMGAFLGSGFSIPFLLLRHQLLKN